MLRTRTFLNLTSAWIALIVTALMTRVVLIDAPATWTEYTGWMFLAWAPVLIAIRLFRGLAPSSIAKVLYDAEHAPALRSGGSKA